MLLNERHNLYKKKDEEERLPETDNFLKTLQLIRIEEEKALM